jgi:hypothetical protein
MVKNNQKSSVNTKLSKKAYVKPVDQVEKSGTVVTFRT